MTNIQECKNSMELGLRDFLNKNASIANKLPNFVILFAQFNSNLDQIQVLREQQEIDTSGISDNKGLLRTNVVTKALDVSRKTETYAKMTNNPILAKEVHYSKTDLNKSSDLKLRDRALIIHDKADENIADLEEYGVNADMLVDLKKVIDLFNASIPEIRTGKTETKQVTRQLNRLLKANDEILVKFDLLVEVVRQTEPVFYSGYKDNRKIINTSVASLALIAKATDAVTGEAIKGAKFTFIPQDEGENKGDAKTEEPLVKRTAKKGILHIKNMTDGPYLTIVAKTGYKPKELLINKAAGDRINLNIKLERI